ncbi:MAG: hypothetical protein NZM44_00930, partial [Candidatus Calescibacterium sp.]|nr:hypothetical protein [Candidatus Calescibacterium sp.]
MNNKGMIVLVIGIVIILGIVLVVVLNNNTNSANNIRIPVPEQNESKKTIKVNKRGLDWGSIGTGLSNFFTGGITG